jgi:hypothetical protein
VDPRALFGLPLAAMDFAAIAVTVCADATMFLVVSAPTEAGAPTLAQRFARRAAAFIPLGLAAGLLWPVIHLLIAWVVLRPRFPFDPHQRAELVIAVAVGSVVVALPVFVLQIAFANATVEETGAAASLRNAWRRLNVAGWALPIAVLIASGIIAALVDGVASRLFNAIFPPVRSVIPFPGGPFPQLPGVPVQGIPGPFGSGIPLGARLLLTLVDVPLNAFLAMVTLGTALAIADFAAEQETPTQR